MNKKIVFTLLVLQTFFCFNILLAQNNVSDLDSLHLDQPDNKDMIDVFHYILNNHNHPHALKPATKTNHYHISVVPAVGYTLQTGFAVDLTGNLGFYTSEHNDANLSSINANIAYTAANQILFPIQTNIWTKHNKFNFQGDWRFYKYPQKTYGLGSLTTDAQGDQLDYSYIRFYESVLKNIGHDFFVGVGYQLDYHWKISEAGNMDGSLSDFSKYGLASTSTSSGISLNFLYDNRRNSINPEKGFCANAVFRNNFTFLGSNSNWQSFQLDMRKYVKLSNHSDNVLAFWSYDWLSFGGNTPYLDLASNGWDTYNNTGRGYVQSRFRGMDMLYFESEFRFKISKNHLFGGVLFANAESFSEPTTNKFTTILPGIGTGIRMQFNKHSRTNIAIDYAVGLRRQGGIFVNLGEVF